MKCKHMVKGTKMEIQYYRNNNIHKNKMMTNLMLIYKKQLKNLMARVNVNIFYLLSFYLEN